MSIKINSNYQTLKPNYTEQLNQEKKNTNEPENNHDVHDKDAQGNNDFCDNNDVSNADKKLGKNGIYIQDEYVRSDASGIKPAGTEHAGENKDGSSEEKVIGSPASFLCLYIYHRCNTIKIITFFS